MEYGKVKRQISTLMEEAKKYRINSIYNYEYEYYNLAPGGCIIKDGSLCEKYGKDRAGYVKWKVDNQSSYCDIGNTYFRKVIKDGQVVGYISETKTKTNESLEEIKKLYEEALDFFFTKLSIKNKKACRIWLETYYYQTIDTNSYISAMTSLDEILTEYTFDENMLELIGAFK